MTERDKLPLLEGALLWAMRAVVLGQNRKVDVSARVDGVFNALHAAAAPAALYTLVDALTRGHGRPLVVQCVCAGTVSADEDALLDLLALVGEGQHAAAYTLLAGMVDSWAAAEGAGAAALLMAAVGGAGHRMPRAGEAQKRYHERHRTNRQPFAMLH